MEIESVQSVLDLNLLMYIFQYKESKCSDVWQKAVITFKLRRALFVWRAVNPHPTPYAHRSFSNKGSDLYLSIFRYIWVKVTGFNHFKLNSSTVFLIHWYLDKHIWIKQPTSQQMQMLLQIYVMSFFTNHFKPWRKSKEEHRFLTMLMP